MYVAEFTSDYELLVEHYGLHWFDMGILHGEAREDWRAEAYRFLTLTRRNNELAAFVVNVTSEPAGTPGCTGF